jgi:prophage antirepressor-like protein
MDRKVFNFQGKDFEVVSLLDANKRRWYAANVFAEICGYAKPNRIIANQVRESNAKNFEEFDQPGVKGIHPKTKFINSSGVLDLLRFSQVPNLRTIFEFYKEILNIYQERLPQPLEIKTLAARFDNEINVQFVFIEVNKERWYLAKTFTTILEFSNHQSAIENNVDKNCKKTLEEIVQDNIAIELQSRQSCDLEPIPPLQLQSQSIFINRAGILELIQRSKMPKANEFKLWVNGEVLPQIIDEGSYDLARDATSKKRQEISALKDLLSGNEAGPSSSTAIANTTTATDINSTIQTIIALQRSYENSLQQSYENALQQSHENQAMKEELAKALSEKEKALLEKEIANLKLNNERLNFKLNNMAIHWGAQALMARDNIENNDQLRSQITAVTNRVTPDISTQPHKQEFIVCYKMGENRIKVVRGQREYVETVGPWYATNIEEMTIMKEECPNPVQIWNSAKQKNARFVYGLRFEHRSKTTFSALTQKELKKKYRNDRMMCKKNLKSRKIYDTEFKALKLKNSKDAILRCWTKPSDLAQKTKDIIQKALEDAKKDTILTDEPVRPPTFKDHYNLKSVVDAVNKFPVFTSNLSLVIHNGPVNNVNNFNTTINTINTINH